VLPVVVGLVNYCIAAFFAVIAPVLAPSLTFFAAFFAAFHPRSWRW
jgi:hypothetical protein